MSLDWLPGLDLSSGTLTLPLWAVGLALALIVALIIMAVVRAGLTEFVSLVFRAAVLLIAVVFGWTYIARTGDRDRVDERRALDTRAAELMGRAVAPGSAIACLEAANTETVEGSCERAVFASPETVAAATAYMAARLSLLADVHEYAAGRDPGYEGAQIAGLRRTVAADRYGLASQVLATRDGCTADVCDAFGLVYDDRKLRANLKDRLFDDTVARYAVNWPSPTRALTSGGPATPNVTLPSAQSTAPDTVPASEPPAAAAPAPAAQKGVPPTNSATGSATKRPPPAVPPKAAQQKSAAPPPTKSAAPPASVNPTTKQ